ncbi:enoyl-CoA hydratase/isomerase family protein [Streptomyces hirsutus]|uniref:enoyl-CoA hydratase/isomerase family protein n=1 Tax=Streptomyces hirsutus TaxID=35620 RepID=UPI00332CA79B
MTALGSYETIDVAVEGGVATVTLDRPERMNAFDPVMVAEFARLWPAVRNEDDVRVVVLRAAGDRAFCTGMDVKASWDGTQNPWARQDPGRALSPKWGHQVWKPLVCAVQGMAAGGAFYWLNEADLILASDDASFFDPHVSFGMAAAPGPIGLSRRIGLSAVLEMTLLGKDRRIDAARALQLGLVTEVVADGLWERADRIAHAIAAHDPLAVQGSVRAVWEGLDQPRTTALDRSLGYSQLAAAHAVAPTHPKGTA